MTSLSARFNQASASGSPRIEIGNTMLITAIQAGDFDLVKQLVKDGADVNEANNLGTTPLHVAAAKGACDIIRFLVKKGAKLNVQKQNKATPFFMAVTNGHVKACATLILLGADKSIPGYQGMSPYEWAVANGQGQIGRKIETMISRYHARLTKLVRRRNRNGRNDGLR